MAFLNAWHRIDCRTREALRRSFLSELIDGYEVCICAFITESGDSDVLALQVQDPFHRLLLYGVCEVFCFARSLPFAIWILNYALQFIYAEFEMNGDELVP